MPLPLTVSCFSKIQIGSTFLVPAYLGSPGKKAVKCVCPNGGGVNHVRTNPSSSTSPRVGRVLPAGGRPTTVAAAADSASSEIDRGRCSEERRVTRRTPRCTEKFSAQAGIPVPGASFSASASRRRICCGETAPENDKVRCSEERRG